MPNYTFVDVQIDEFVGSSHVFRKDSKGFSLTLGKDAIALNRVRQQYFETHLQRIAAYLRSPSIPVFLDIRGWKVRLDKGCVGHAVARGFLRQPVNGPSGKIEFVTLVDFTRP